MTTEWGALTGLFPIDSTLEIWLRARATVAAMYQFTDLCSASTAERFSHQRLDELFANPMSADRGAKYAKYLHLNLCKALFGATFPLFHSLCLVVMYLSRADDAAWVQI